jgi:hypothetical protein
MGVQGLRKTLEETLKDTNAIEKKTLGYLKKMYDVKVIGVDVMPYLYLNLNHPIRFRSQTACSQIIRHGDRFPSPMLRHWVRHLRPQN